MESTDMLKSGAEIYMKCLIDLQELNNSSTSGSSSYYSNVPNYTQLSHHVVYSQPFMHVTSTFDAYESSTNACLQDCGMFATQGSNIMNYNDSDTVSANHVPSPELYEKCGNQTLKYCKSAAVEKKTRRPLNAFMLYAKDHREQIQEIYSISDGKILSKFLGMAWQVLPSNEKQKYRDLAEAMRRDHIKMDPECFKLSKTSGPRSRSKLKETRERKELIAKLFQMCGTTFPAQKDIRAFLEDHSQMFKDEKFLKRKIQLERLDAMKDLSR